VTFTLQRVGPSFDRYATAVWIAPTAGEEPARQLPLGARRDGHGRWSPDGRSIAFLSDRRTLVEEEPGAPKDREDGTQIHLLPASGPGEARRLTDLPRGVDTFEWSPDGRCIAVLSASRGSTREADARARRALGESKPGTPPASDYRFADRLHFQENGQGFTGNRTSQVWLVDAQTGAARRLTDLAACVNELAWSPDGSHLAITTGGTRLHDLLYRPRVVVVDVGSGSLTPVAEHRRGVFFGPAWLPDGQSIAVMGGMLPHQAYRNEIWLFQANGSDPTGGRDLSSRHDVMPASSLNSDVTIGEGTGLRPTADGAAILFLAPHRGASELWRIAIADGALERITDGRHYLSSFDVAGGGPGSAGVARIVAVRSTAVEVPDLFAGTLPATGGAASIRPPVASRARIASQVSASNSSLKRKPGPPTSICRRSRSGGPSWPSWPVGRGRSSSAAWPPTAA